MSLPSTYTHFLDRFTRKTYPEADERDFKGMSTPES